VHADVDYELAFHLQARISDLVEQGISPDDARRRALEEFGDVEEFRARLTAIDDRIARRERRTEWLDGLRQDVAYALRALRHSPGVTVSVVLTLALGLGVNVAMLTLLNAVFLRPPSGVDRPSVVRRLWTEVALRSGSEYWPGYDYQQYEAVSDAVRGVADVTLYRQGDDVKVGRGVAASRAMLAGAPADYFRLLGVRPALGRFFSEDEDRLGAGQRVVVASHAYWQRALGGDSTVLGDEIRIDGAPYTLIGVADPAFTGVDLSSVDLWRPLASEQGYGDEPWWTDSRVNGFQILLRLEPGVTDAAVDSRATLALRRAELARFKNSATAITRVGSIITARGPGKRLQEVEIATRLAGVALIVLVIACANVVSLLLARAVRRRREIAMRLALGISRGRLARLILTESVLLAALAGTAAVVEALWGGMALRRLLLPDVHWAQSPVDWRVLVIAIVATLAAGLTAGIVPAVQSGRMELSEALKSGGRGVATRRSRLRSFLVMAQVALSIVLLVGAVLFVRSLSNVRGLDLGFDARRLMFARVGFDTKDARRDSLMPGRLREAADRIRAIAGVQSVALTAMRPMYGFSTSLYYPDADTLTHKKPWGMYWAVSPEYFRTAGMEIVAGTGFPNATGSAMPPSVIVNTAMAAALWPGESPIGRCVRFEKPEERCNTVIGIVETAHWDEVIEESTPQFYLPLANMPFPAQPRAIAIRVDEAMAPAVSREVRRILLREFPGGDPDIQRMATVLEPKYRPWRLGATLFSLFGVLALVVAAFGVYSTVSYNVSQRTHEFGVRAALGAQAADIVRYVLRDGLSTVLVGLVAGVLLALGAGRVVASLLYGVAPRDPLALTVVTGLLMVVAVGAALVPAWRASRADPLLALRNE
jgi:predicted permease